MKKNYVNVIFGVAALTIISALFLTNNPQSTIDPRATELPKDITANVKKAENNVEFNTMPEMQIDQTKSYSAKVTTTLGEFTLKLNADKTPITVNNFVFLAKEGYYNNTVFHRVIKDFMIQGGDPTGTGAGGPGYKFDDEPFEGDYNRGTVAMANAGPNTNGSQFFVMHKDMALPKNYVIFGSISKGLETLDAIATQEVEVSQMGEMSKPKNPTKILSVEIMEE